MEWGPLQVSERQQENPFDPHEGYACRGSTVAGGRHAAPELCWRMQIADTPKEGCNMPVPPQERTGLAKLENS